MRSPHGSRETPHWSAYLALASVCVFWGTTYLGIRIAVETLPPAVLMCARYLLSGAVLLAGCRVVGAKFPCGRELWLTCACGVMTIGIGTGLLAYVEQWVPSGLSALFVVTSPFWLTAAEAVMPVGSSQPAREPLHAPTIGAMAVGAAGVVLLVTGPEAISVTPGGLGLASAFLLLQLGAVAWAAGSILQRRQSSPVHPIVSAAVQQLATGLIYVPPALFQFRQAHWTGRAIGATLYLAMFGGVVGYSSYVFAMARLPVAIASVYTYVNPLVAVLLGWMFYNESFSAREAVAMAVIFAGVWLVKRAAASSRPRSGAARKRGVS